MSTKVSTTIPPLNQADSKSRVLEKQKRTGDDDDSSYDVVSSTCSDSSSPSSNPSLLPDNSTQGVDGGHGHHGIIADNDKHRFTETSEVKVPQNPKRGRNSTPSSASVKDKKESKDRVLARADLKHSDTSVTLSTSGYDVVGRGGRASSGGVSEGKEPPFRDHGCLSTAAILKLVTILAALGSVGLVWLQYDAATGKLCPHGKNKPCLDNLFSMAKLTIAKLCAGALFPSISICVLSKCYAIRYHLNNSWLAFIVDFEPTHHLHIFYGVVIVFFSMIHGAAHVAHLAYEGRLERLHDKAMHRSGVVALVLLLPTALPMMVGFLKKKLTFEVRKLMHLVFIPFTIAICFHGGALRRLGAILLVLYLADRLYFTTKMTFFIDQPNYKIVGKGTFVRFYLPAGYHFKPGAYIQVNCPAISTMEWHPFSMFPVSGSRPRAGFHAEAVGDWTEELFRLSLTNPQMPLWITTAQPSVLERTAYYENVVLVCTGSGITPAVCVIERLAKTKNVHLLWLSREASMIAMFEKQVRRVRSTVHLTGKPSNKTKNMIINLLAPARSQVVASTAAATAITSVAPSSTTQSNSNPAALEEGSRYPAPSLRDFPGALRDDDVRADQKSEQSSKEDETKEYPTKKPFGRQEIRPNLDENDDDDAKETRQEDRRRNRRNIENKKNNNGTRGNHQRSSGSYSHNVNSGERLRGLRPISVCFGRPDIERFITETVEGTAVTAEWADANVGTVANERSPLSARLPQPNARAPLRLSTNQRISKKDLMSADLSVGKSKSFKLSSTAGHAAAAIAPKLETASSKHPCTDRRSWLVIFCGANMTVEKSVASTCGKLKVAWRKEYFSEW